MNEPDDPAPSGAPEEALPRLYSLNSIGFSTFFGSMLAGFFLLAANYHALGMKKPAAGVIVAGLVAFCVYFVAIMAWLGPGSLNPAVSQTEVIEINMTEAILSNVGQVLFLLLITQLLQGSMLSTFKEELQGSYHSVTRSILIGFAAYVGLASICMLILSVFGLMPTGTPERFSA
jgi:apolipoprotein N-acyltransferase|tara:strand:- start:577 stop:1101 length:525 start_codon:yes stop_codon:yes gene_type:complete